MLDGNWLWKPEPVSLNGAPCLYINPNWLSINPNLVENAVNTDESILYNEHSALNEVNKITTNSNELVKEEPLYDWLEEKINFSDFDGLPIEITANDGEKLQQFVNPSKVIPQPHLQPTPLPSWDPMQHIQIAPEKETDLLQEFENILNSSKSYYTEIEPTELTADFPARTINHNDIYELVMQDSSLLSSHTSSYIEDPISSPISSPLSSVSEEMPTTAWNTTSIPQLDFNETPTNESEEAPKKDLKEELEDSTDNDGEAFIKEDESFSPISDSCDDSVDSSAMSNDDPDWSISGRVAKKTNRKSTRAHPYVKKKYVKVPPDERKVRKKEQNKNAATRYRQKKKLEVLEIVNEEQQLVDKNNALKDKVTDLEREIRYLKNLLRDLYKVKGLIK